VNYFLSRAADADLQDIYQFGYGVWGEHRTARYIYDLYDLFDRLSLSPGMGRARPDIHVVLQSFPHESHMVFFRQLNRQIAIVRVLHGAANHHKQFEDYDPVADLPTG